MSDKAQKEKEKGNAAFKTADYPTAIGHYTAAILADRKDPTYPLNRAAAYLKLGKYEDAERDCNTVLGLSAKNVKGCFRRGQAKVGLGKFVEAQRDFTEALRLEPDNQVTKEELRKVAELIENEKRKKPQQPRHVGTTAFDSSFQPTPAPKRRRVPITIVEPPTSSNEDLANDIERKKSGPEILETPKKPSKPPLPPASIGLEAVSSRPLKPSPATSTPGSEPEPKATAATSSPAASSTKPATKPKASFKEAREDVKTRRAGGGIFRASGQNTIFPTRDGKPSSPVSPASAAPVEETLTIPVEKQGPTSSNSSASESKTQSLPELGHEESIKFPQSGGIPTKSPATLFDFNRAWQLALTSAERWKLMQMITPSNIPSFCKTSLEPTLLVSILETFLVILSQPGSEDVSKIREYMDNLGKVPRFSTLVLFLNAREKGIAKEVWRKLDVSSAPGVWSAIGNLGS